MCSFPELATLIYFMYTQKGLCNDQSYTAGVILVKFSLFLQIKLSQGHSQSS